MTLGGCTGGTGLIGAVFSTPIGLFALISDMGNNTVTVLELEAVESLIGTEGIRTGVGFSILEIVDFSS